MHGGRFNKEFALQETQEIIQSITLNSKNDVDLDQFVYFNIMIQFGHDFVGKIGKYMLLSFPKSV